MGDKDEVLNNLKWFRDEYVSPDQFSSKGIDLETPSRKTLCTMFIDFLEKGINSDIVKKHEEIFFRLIKCAEIERKKSLNENNTNTKYENTTH